MSVISTSTGFSEATKALSHKEYQIGDVQKKISNLLQMSAQANGNPALENYYHNVNVQLENYKNLLEAEYGALQKIVESQEKLRKNSIERSFKISI